MTKYLDEKFSVSVGDTQQYRDNWEAIFGAKREALIKRCMAISCPKCNVAIGVPCDPIAAKENPGNQFHTQRIDASKVKD